VKEFIQLNKIKIDNERRYNIRLDAECVVQIFDFLLRYFNSNDIKFTPDDDCKIFKDKIDVVDEIISKRARGSQMYEDYLKNLDLDGDASNSSYKNLAKCLWEYCLQHSNKETTHSFEECLNIHVRDRFKVLLDDLRASGIVNDSLNAVIAQDTSDNMEHMIFQVSCAISQLILLNKDAENKSFYSVLQNLRKIYCGQPNMEMYDPTTNYNTLVELMISDNDEMLQRHLQLLEREIHKDHKRPIIIQTIEQLKSIIATYKKCEHSPDDGDEVVTVPLADQKDSDVNLPIVVEQGHSGDAVATATKQKHASIRTRSQLKRKRSSVEKTTATPVEREDSHYTSSETPSKRKHLVNKDVITEQKQTGDEFITIRTTEQEGESISPTEEESIVTATTDQERSEEESEKDVATAVEQKRLEEEEEESNAAVVEQKHVDEVEVKQKRLEEEAIASASEAEQIYLENIETEQNRLEKEVAIATATAAEQTRLEKEKESIAIDQKHLENEVILSKQKLSGNKIETPSKRKYSDDEVETPSKRRRLHDEFRSPSKQKHSKDENETQSKNISSDKEEEEVEPEQTYSAPRLASSTYLVRLGKALPRRSPEYKSKRTLSSHESASATSPGQWPRHKFSFEKSLEEVLGQPGTKREGGDEDMATQDSDLTKGEEDMTTQDSSVDKDEAMVTQPSFEDKTEGELIRDSVADDDDDDDDDL
jgi:hypothetical protein